MERMAGDILVGDRILKTGLRRIKVIDDRRLVSRIYTAEEFSHSVIKNDAGNVYCVDVIRNAAIRRGCERIAGYQHISPHIIGIRLQHAGGAIDEIRIPGFEAGDELTRGRALDAVQIEFVVEA